MIHYSKEILHPTGVSICASCFQDDEAHIYLTPPASTIGFAQQMANLAQAEEALRQLPQWQGFICVARRYFLSDSTNQQPLLPNHAPEACSAIQQPLLNGSKVVVWLYLVREVCVTQQEGVTCAARNGYTHLWTQGLQGEGGGSYCQTERLLNAYSALLQKHNATVAGHCIRTWFYVRDVDTNYKGLVNARREWFHAHGLTKDTHYIASTGIGGSPANVEALVQMEAYALLGHKPEQVRHLSAPQFLNPTHEYGVTFERGTVVEYGDRAHLFISGTASIDSKGQVVCPGDIVGQTRRMWENVDALLADGRATREHLAQIIVYLRDMADYPTVKVLFEEYAANVPAVFNLAPVCRPAWLIEMECIAIVPRTNPYPAF